MRPITHREILEACAALRREIEAGRITEPLSQEDVRREKEQRKKKNPGVSQRFKLWRDAHPRPPRNPMLPGEIPLKQYIDERAATEGIPRSTLVANLFKSNYAGVPIRRVNKRVVFVQMEPQTEKQFVPDPQGKGVLEYSVKKKI